LFECPTSAASAPTRNDPCSSRNLSAARLVGGDGIVHAGEAGVRVLLGELGEVVGEDEADADHEVHPFGGEQAEAGFAVGALAGLDEPDVHPELLLGPLGTEIRAVVERLVAAPAEVEHHAHVHRVAGGRDRGAGRVHEEERHVDDEQHAHEDEKLLHISEKSCAGRMNGRAGCKRSYPGRPASWIADDRKLRTGLPDPDSAVGQFRASGLDTVTQDCSLAE
jgi:hypothetical protein